MFCPSLGSSGLFFALKMIEGGYKSHYSISEISTSAVPPNSKRSMGLPRKRRFPSPVQAESQSVKRGLKCHLMGWGPNKCSLFPVVNSFLTQSPWSLQPMQPAYVELVKD